MDLEHGVKDADEAHQNHETRGEEVHDKFQGILQQKRTDERLDAEDKKKKRKECDQQVLPQGEARIHGPYLPKII
jgi:hypothetical protein